MLIFVIGIISIDIIQEWKTDKTLNALRDLSAPHVTALRDGKLIIAAKDPAERILTLCGLIGLADPPRESVKSDIATCVRAGIRVVMITGDMLNNMTDKELQEKMKRVNIFSRVIPEHKMRIVKAFKENGEIVAMTGDGVNDAPALKYADIGIAGIDY